MVEVERMATAVRSVELSERKTEMGIIHITDYVISEGTVTEVNTETHYIATREAADTFLDEELTNSAAEQFRLNVLGLFNGYQGRPGKDDFTVYNYSGDGIVAVSRYQWAEGKEMCAIIDHFPVEVGLSDCDKGCKIYKCNRCDTPEEVIHNTVYGCRITV